MNMKWILIKDKLPPNYEWVMFYFNDAHSEPHVEIGLIDKNGSIVLEGCDNPTLYHLECLTHWMHLPKPPKI